MSGCVGNYEHSEQYKPSLLQRTIALPGRTDDTIRLPGRAMMLFRRDGLLLAEGAVAHPSFDGPNFNSSQKLPETVIIQ